MVLYENGESRYLENSQPVAIFLKGDEVAVYVKDLPKLRWREASKMCYELDIGNLYWVIPNSKQLQILLDYREEVDQTLTMLNLPPLHKNKYWGRTKVDFDIRQGLDFSSGREIYIEESQHAYTRPFLRLG